VYAAAAEGTVTSYNGRLLQREDCAGTQSAGALVLEDEVQKGSQT
jgi:hypothetical protein